jgi:hypothetical protein
VRGQQTCASGETPAFSNPKRFVFKKPPAAVCYFFLAFWLRWVPFFLRVVDEILFAFMSKSGDS